MAYCSAGRCWEEEMKYIKLPEQVEAEQYFKDVLPWPKGVCNKVVCSTVDPHVHTIIGITSIQDSDYVTAHRHGQYDVYSSESFFENYAPK